jgi:hypothetical protein
MFLNVLKGAYPGLQQVDLALPMAAGQTGIERGSLLKVNSDREWEVAAASDAGSETAPGAFVYIALMAQDDLVAGMAGNVGQGVISAAAGQPVINALAIVPSMQIETDMYDPQADWDVGDWAQVDDGGVFTVHGGAGETAIAKVDAVPASRWVNNAVAVTGWRTGGPMNVIRLTTVYIPNLPSAS